MISQYYGMAGPQARGSSPSRRGVRYEQPISSYTYRNNMPVDSGGAEQAAQSAVSTSPTPIDAVKAMAYGSGADPDSGMTGYGGFADIGIGNPGSYGGTTPTANPMTPQDAMISSVFENMAPRIGTDIITDVVKDVVFDAPLTPLSPIKSLKFPYDVYKTYSTYTHEPTSAPDMSNEEATALVNALDMDEAMDMIDAMEDAAISASAGTVSGGGNPGMGSADTGQGSIAGMSPEGAGLGGPGASSSPGIGAMGAVGGPIGAGLGGAGVGGSSGGTGTGPGAPGSGAPY